MTSNKRKLHIEDTITLNNKASVEDLQKDVKAKNSKADLHYTMMFGRLETISDHKFSVHHLHSGHPVNIFPEEFDGDLNPGYFKTFSYKCTKPHYISSIRYVDRRDPVTKIMHMKQYWKQKTKRSMAIAEHYSSEYVKLNEEVVKCPKKLIELARNLEIEPDPYFNSMFNWYYSGHGNMHLITIDCIDYLLHSELNFVHLSQFSKIELKIKIGDVKFDCGENIHETIYSGNQFVALRTKNRVIFLKISTNDDRLAFQKLRVINSVLPYTSITFDKYHNNIIYITNLDNTLSIVNLARMTKRTIDIEKPKSLVDNFNSIQPIDVATYCHMTSKVINFYDNRSHQITFTLPSHNNISDLCNKYCAIRQFEAPIMYVATSHHIYTVDTRFTRRKYLQRFTHNMISNPTYLSQAKSESNKDIVCLSSQWCEDMLLLVNNYEPLLNNSQQTEVQMPFHPKSILDVLSEANKNMLCNDIYNPIGPRIKTALTGCLIYEIAENYSILMQNALGDISVHTLYPNHFRNVNDKAIQQLHNWSMLYKPEKKKYVVNQILDFADILRDLKKVPDNYVFSSKMSKGDNELKYNEKDIVELINNKEIDEGLLDVWNVELDGIDLN